MMLRKSGSTSTFQSSSLSNNEQYALCRRLLWQLETHKIRSCHDSQYEIASFSTIEYIVVHRLAFKPEFQIASACVHPTIYAKLMRQLIDQILNYKTDTAITMR